MDAWRKTVDPKVINAWQAFYLLKNRDALAAQRRARRADERGGKRYLTAAEMHAQFQPSSPSSPSS